MKYTVLHSLGRMNRGGAETLIMNIYRHIDHQKYSFCFLLNDADCDYADEIRQLGGTIYTIAPRSNGVISYCKSLYLFFREHDGEFNAVHMHTSSLSSMEVLFFAKLFKIKKRVIHSHSTVQEGLIHSILHWLNKPWVRVLATDYLSCSQVASDWLYKYTGVLNKSIVIKNGIDLDQFKYNESFREEIREQYNIADSAIVIGHVGRFDLVKNHSFLVDVFYNYHILCPNSVLICVGVGNTFNDISILVREKGIHESVIFAGLQSEVYKFLSAFDFFVFPSLYEGLPVSLVEAQASGVMTICSDKVSKEACLSDYISQFELSKSAKEWAKYISSISPLNRSDFVKQVEEKGYSIIETVRFLANEIYV